MASRIISCAACTRRLRSGQHRRRVGNQSNRALLTFLEAKFQRCINVGDFLCSPCCKLYYRQDRSSLIAEPASPNPSTSAVSSHSRSDFSQPSGLSEEEPGTSSSSPELFPIPLLKAITTHAYCFVCKTKNKDLVVIPGPAKSQALLERIVFVPKTNRCCPEHLVDGFFVPEALEMVEASEQDVMLSGDDVRQLFEGVNAVAKRQAKIDFDDPVALDDRGYFNLTSLRKDQFDSLISFLSTLRNTKNRSGRTALALLLTKLRTGLSHEVLATIFHLPDFHAVSNAIDSARVALMKEFVPLHLGFTHISRESFIAEHTTTLARELFSPDRDAAIVVVDGTYVYIEKSQNYTFQRQTFSMHKHRCLVKPMLIVATDGYILDVTDPHLANGNNNDASILKYTWAVDEDLRAWMKPEDIFVVDRGFRDALDFLDQLGFQSRMPAFLEKGASQHDAVEANESRLVTKIRWVVESANGLIKTFFQQVVRNTQLSKVRDYVRIVCAILNAYRPPRKTDDPDDLLIARRMLHLADFPRLSVDNLRFITLGVYQLKQARSYTAEHLDEDGSYEVRVHREKEGLLRVKIQSRHVQSKAYNLWISYEATTEGAQSIKAWYCKCRTGARVVGCCAHIAAVLWYLGQARFEAFSAPAYRNAHLFLDAALLPATQSGSSD